MKKLPSLISTLSIFSLGCAALTFAMIFYINDQWPHALSPQAEFVAHKLCKSFALGGASGMALVMVLIFILKIGPQENCCDEPTKNN
jgi:hypothetical protein